MKPLPEKQALVKCCLPLVMLYLVLFAISGVVNAETILHEQRSLYSDIIVKQTGSHVCLLFKVKSNQRNQSCINERAPKKMVFSYTRMAISSLLFIEDPKSVLAIGLGGGTLPTALAELYPQAEIDTVEIDPAVVAIAEKFFRFKASEKLRVSIQDARVWVKRALLKQQSYDLIILDAFNGEYIPEHLMTADFFTELKQLLTDQGVFVSNTFGLSELYDHESATYAHVFDDFINFRVPDSANRLVLAPQQTLSDEALAARATELAEALSPYHVPIKKYARTLTRLRQRNPDWDTQAEVFTDQYAPANALRGR